MPSLGDRMLRAARLDTTLYEEVEADTSATLQALVVVLLSSLAAGLGASRGLRGALIGSAAALLGWYVWAGLAYWIGTRWLPERQTTADWGQMLRTVGFAYTPGVLRLFGAVPLLYPIVFVATGLWMLIAVVIAVRQALDFRSTWRALGVCLLGWAAQWLIFEIVLAVVRRGG